MPAGDVQRSGAGNVTDEPDSGYWRLEDQIRWYDAKSTKAQQAYKWLRGTEIVVAALVPVCALVLPDKAIVPGTLGAVILILAGFLELGAHQRNWIKYRSTCEALRHEKFLYIARAGPYENRDDQSSRNDLATRVEALVSEENTNWSKHMETQRAKEAKARAETDGTGNPR